MTVNSRTLYARLLRLRHLRLTQLTTFVLFEGSVLIAIVLALAEITNWWGVLLLPLTVAIMVKVNDLVAGVLARPQAIAQVVRPGVVPMPAVGWSPVPAAARMTGEIDRDDAVPDPEAQPEPDALEAPRDSGPDGKVIRGIAAVPRADERRPPSPGINLPHPGGADHRVRGNQGRFVS